MEIRVRNSENTRLARILYISKFKINLLSGRILCESGLKELWDLNGLYLYDKKEYKIIGVIKYKKIYIINKIITRFTESAFNIFTCACYYFNKFGGRVF